MDTKNHETIDVAAREMASWLLRHPLLRSLIQSRLAASRIPISHENVTAMKARLLVHLGALANPDEVAA